MEKVGVVVYRVLERIVLNRSEVHTFVKAREKDPLIRCRIVPLESDLEEEGDAKPSCSGSGRIGKRLGMRSDTFDTMPGGSD